MKFYDRLSEMTELSHAESMSQTQGMMTVLMGRRRIGKTLLILEAFKNIPHLYFFISRKPETLLCEEFLSEIKRVYNIPVFGEITTFAKLFEFILHTSKTQHITLVIDEFQEFYAINPSVYSGIQKLWDAKKAAAKIHVVFIGSIYALMTKIFITQKEPLFGRADKFLSLEPFDLSVIDTIIREQHKGMPRYIDILVTNKCFTLDSILKFVLNQNNPFFNDVRNLLIEEFGKEYGMYFSILECIAEGKTSRPEIESVLEKSIGGYLDNLETQYHLVEKIKPMYAKPLSRTIKYAIIDNFTCFWFRYINKYRSAAEAGNTAYIASLFKSDYAQYAEGELRAKAINPVKEFQGYEIEYKGFSLEDYS